MPKRKGKDDLDNISRKIKKLEKKLKRVRRRQESRDSTPDLNDQIFQESVVSPTLTNLAETTLDGGILDEYPITDPPADTGTTQAAKALSEPEVIVVEEQPSAPSTSALDSDVLAILGDDPTAVVQLGKDIHQELANRLEHTATTGLTKEVRKELNDKFLLPGNSVKIGAPEMNPEIKAAVTDVVMKRDRGIEARQKQLASAISGLAEIINMELDSKNKDDLRLKRLMDVSRILCDIQHAESVTRRNFAIFSVKKDLKEHLNNTKIDKFLFGENLSEALKTAKAVMKSGTELKIKNLAKPRPATLSTGNLNWKAPVPARRQQGPARHREPAPPQTMVPPAQYSRAPPHAASSKTSQHPPKQTRRR